MLGAERAVSQIADRLCCSFGQDLQDSLFSRQTFGRRHDGSRPHIRPIALIALNTAYVGALAGRALFVRLALTSHLRSRAHSRSHLPTGDSQRRHQFVLERAFVPFAIQPVCGDKR